MNKNMELVESSSYAFKRNKYQSKLNEGPDFRLYFNSLNLISKKICASKQAQGLH